MFRLIKISVFLNLKEIRNIALMILLPILLTLILGVALSSVFNDNNSAVLPPSIWLYYIEDTDEGEHLREFLSVFSSQLNMEMAEQSNRDDAILDVSNLNVDGYLIYTGGTMTIYKNEHSSDSIKWLEIVFNNYLIRASIIDNIVENSQDLNLLQFIQDNAMNIGSHVELLQIDSARQPDAIGYYAVAMITLTSCYSIIVMILGLSEEIKKNTLRRYLLSGKSLFSFLFSKSVSICLVLFIQLSIVMLFCALVYRVDFGDLRSWVTILISLSIFTFAVTQSGILLSLLFKNLSALNIIINAAVLPTVLFFGGAYLHFYRLIDMGLGNIIVFSPVYHINRGLFDVIYLNSYYYIFNFSITVAVVSLLILAVNAILSKWRNNSWVQ